MCGIFGLNINKSLNMSDRCIKSVTKDLFLLSESRGKEASGICTRRNNKLIVYKSKLAASEFIRTTTFKKLLSNLSLNNDKNINFFGHSRLVTDGSEESYNNNQPVAKNGITCVHNGIIVNSKKLWHEFSFLNRESDLDTEVFVGILGHFLKESGNLLDSIKKTYNIAYGMASIAAYFSNLNNMLLSTNNGSLYYVKDKANTSLIFASEFYILEKMVKKDTLNPYFSASDIKQLEPNNAVLIDFDSGASELKHFNSNDDFSLISKSKKTIEIAFFGKHEEKSIKEKLSFLNSNDFNAEFDKNQKLIQNIRRCKKCLLPETFPHIEFDYKGICNYCKIWEPLKAHGKKALTEKLSTYKTKSKYHDSIIAFSGGRDSSYSLHYAVKELGMNPIAYSYDWGMITDLARRNQSRLCSKLGVEHILVSADIRKKRKNIRKNVEAWLSKPDLGTIPLFMAGDKQYFYYAYQLRKQNNIDLLILGENHYEKTSFKSGFSGAKQEDKGSMAYNISSMNKIKMLLYYAKTFATNTKFLNSSIIDTTTAFASFYLLPHEYLNLYDYILWDEKVIEETLIGEYDWELSNDTKSTWRIGDGTAPFYNYIYYMVAGFSEIETFRSNQIRENVITRDEGMSLIFEENKPRWESIKWYCDTIGIDFESAIKRINQIPKLYE